jgi:hydroxymethylglutaryl-CoA synthase
MSSPSWDGRYAIVVCGDIAVYESGPARPTGGAGAIAMLLGKDAPIGFNLADPRATHMEDVYDFYKPIGHHASEYPQVDGHLSNTCYHRSIDRCVERLAKKCALKHKHDFDIRNFDHAIFHYPYVLVFEYYPSIEFKTPTLLQIRQTRSKIVRTLSLESASSVSKRGRFLEQIS